MKRTLPLLLLASCSIHTQGVALSGTVDLTVSNPQNLVFSGPLLGAVVWVGSGGMETTAVVAVDADGGVTLPIEAPVDFPTLDAGPMETLSIESVPAYRPRLVIFEDTNLSGAFEFDGLDAGAGDHVRAVDGADSMAFVPDVEGMLQAFTTGETDTYYQATEGAFTPYLRVLSDPNNGLDLETPSPIALNLSDGLVPDADLSCQRSVKSGPLSLSLAFTSPSTAHVNAGLNAVEVCSKAVGSCVQETLASQNPVVQPLFIDDHVRVVECQQAGTLESVQIFEAFQGCDGCTCSWAGTYDVYVAASAALPSWWPCGVTIHYCNRGTGLFTISSGCVSPTG